MREAHQTTRLMSVVSKHYYSSGDRGAIELTACTTTVQQKLQQI